MDGFFHLFAVSLNQLYTNTQTHHIALCPLSIAKITIERRKIESIYKITWLFLFYVIAMKLIVLLIEKETISCKHHSCQLPFCLSTL